MFQHLSKVFRLGAAPLKKNGKEASLTSETYIKYAYALDDPVQRRKSLLNIASEFKKRGDPFKACEILMDVIDSAPLGQLDISLYLRLPLYLQQAKNNSAASAYLDALEKRFLDPRAQAEIAATRRDFLRGKGDYRNALLQDMLSYARFIVKERRAPDVPAEAKENQEKLLNPDNIMRALQRSMELAGVMQFRKTLVRDFHYFLCTKSTYGLFEIERVMKQALRMK